MAVQRTRRNSQPKRLSLRLAASILPVVLTGLLLAPFALAAGSAADSAGTRQVSPARGPQVPAGSASASLKYKVGTTGATITDCEESATEIAVPAYLEGKPVTAIGYSAFSNCADLTAITLPSTLKAIGDSAFVNCSALKAIALPEGLTQLGEESFLNCTSLSEFNIPASLESFSGNAFANCPKIRFSLAGANPGYILQGGVIYTKDQKTLVVAGASDSPNPVVPDTVTKVGDGAFRNKSLTAITMGSHVTAIGKEAFSGCSQLEEVNLNEGLTMIDDSAFAGTSALKALELPGSLTSLGITVFQGSGLESINLSGTQLTTLPLGTFWDCLHLQDIVLGDKITAIEKGVFRDCTFKTITLPAQLRSLGGCFINCPNLETLTVPYSVRELGSSMFPNCTALKTIYFEGNMPLRGDKPENDNRFYARKGDSFAQLPLKTAENLKIYVLQGAKGWGDFFEDYADGYAMGTTKRRHFEYKVSYYPLAEDETPHLILHPPESLTALAAGSFAEAIEVVKAGMPKDAGPVEWSPSDSGVATVDSSGRVAAVAEGASQITAAVTYRGTVYTAAAEVNVSAAESIFKWSRQSDGTVIINGFRDGLDKAQMTYLEIPETIAGYRVSAIKDFAFKDNLNIFSVTIPGSLKTVGAYAFGGCLCLSDITLGDGIEAINDGAFSATLIRTVDIPRSVARLQNYAFKDCPRLESATVESGNLDYSLGAGLFWNCTNLKKVSLAEGIKETGGLTFAGCGSLESITLPSTLQALSFNDFSGCTALKSIGLQSYLLKQDMRDKPRAKDYSPFAALKDEFLGLDLPECNKVVVILHPDDGNDWDMLFDNRVRTETSAAFGNGEGREVGSPNPLDPGPENSSPNALAASNSAPAPETSSHAAPPMALGTAAPDLDSINSSGASKKATDGPAQNKMKVFEIVKDAVAENPLLSLAAGAIILAVLLLGGIGRYRRYVRNQ